MPTKDDYRDWVQRSVAVALAAKMPTPRDNAGVAGKAEAVTAAKRAKSKAAKGSSQPT